MNIKTAKRTEGKIAIHNRIGIFTDFSNIHVMTKLLEKL